MTSPPLRPVLEQIELPGFPGHYRGKVRENYDLADGRRILIATDRLSAFDRILAAIPYKGQVLTQTARYWFEKTADICPNHVLEYPDPNVVVGRRLDILPVEIVVRAFLAGTTGTSVLTLYSEGARDMYGVRLPDGLRPNQRLPNVILTPHIGGSTEEAQEAIGAFAAERLLAYLNRGDTTFCVNLPNVQLAEVDGAHRILHIHRNQPGVLAELNRALAAAGLNILGQHLKTDERTGYVITDVDRDYDPEALQGLRSVAGTLRFRMLH